VSKDTLDANCARGQRKQARTFENNPDGWKRLLSWLKAMGGKQAHVCESSDGSAAPASWASAITSINIARHAINRMVASPMTASVPVVANNVLSDGLCQASVAAWSKVAGAEGASRP
jgi:hypothetical protein